MLLLKTKDDTGCDIIINMNNVTFIEFSDDDKPIFHFIDEAEIAVVLDVNKFKLIEMLEKNLQVCYAI